MAEPQLKINPFTPDAPVAPELFAGRTAEVLQVQGALESTCRRASQHILIQGDRWMGKSSIALYVQNMAEMADQLLQPDPRFFTAFCRLGACRNLDEVCVLILDQFRSLQNALRHRVLDLLGQVRGLSVGMFGVQLDRDSTRPPLVPTFASVFERIIEEARESHNAFLVILDETEHVSALPGTASFLKTLLEQLGADGFRDVMFLMTGTRECVERLVDDHPSFPRLFRYVDLDPMSREESDELLSKALARGEPEASISEEALDVAHRYSDGFPGVLQEIGFAAFDVNGDNEIDFSDIATGMTGAPGHKGAVETLYDKHFHRILTRQLLSDRYRDILRVVASSASDVVSFREISGALAGRLDANSIGGYLAQLVKRGVLLKEEGQKGQYRLASRMLGLWLRMEPLRETPTGRSAPTNSSGRATRHTSRTRS